MATAAERAAQKIRDEFNEAITSIRGTAAASEFLIERYIELREKIRLTADEQRELSALSDILAERFPEAGNDVRDLSGDLSNEYMGTGIVYLFGVSS